MTPPPGLSRVALIGALVAVLSLATAAVLFIGSDDSAMQRLALLFGLFGIALPGIVSLIKADQAAAQTDVTSNIARSLNGQFDARVQTAAQRANEATAAGELAPVLGAPGTGEDTPAP